MLVHPDGSKYTGQFKNGKFHGIGKFEGKDGSKYEGEYKDGKMHGKGMYECTHFATTFWLACIDFYVFTKTTHIGSYKFKSGDIYEGAFRNDKSHGYGVYRSIYGDVYEGTLLPSNYNCFLQNEVNLSHIALINIRLLQKR